MLPNRALTDIDIKKYTQNLYNYRGTFMRNNLPKSAPLQNECGIINLDDKTGSGTHWVAYRKTGFDTIYFDSFGNLKPPLEFMQYIGNPANLYYNYTKHQDYDTIICGHLCLKFLYNQL